MDEELIALINAYLRIYPDAQNPKGYIHSYGLEGIKTIIKESKGREIIFIQDLENPINPDEVYFEYS